MYTSKFSNTGSAGGLRGQHVWEITDKVGLDIEWDRIRGINGDFWDFYKINWINDGTIWWKEEDRVVGLGGRKNSFACKE